MRLMSFNIQHGIDHAWRLQSGEERINLPLMADAVKRCGADICGLNEVYGAGELPLFNDQARVIADALGYYAFFAKAIDIAENQPYGNALISKYPFIDTTVLPIPVPKDIPCEPRCILRATVDINGTPIRVLVTHMGLSDAERVLAVETLVKEIEATDLPLVLMGDFNATPHDPVLSPLYARMEDTLQAHGEASLCSFPSHAPDRRIDYIFVRGITCTKADLPQIVSADHCPHTADVSLCVGEE